MGCPIHGRYYVRGPVCLIKPTLSLPFFVLNGAIKVPDVPRFKHRLKLVLEYHSPSVCGVYRP